MGSVVFCTHLNHSVTAVLVYSLQLEIIKVSSQKYFLEHCSFNMAPINYLVSLYDILMFKIVNKFLRPPMFMLGLSCAHFLEVFRGVSGGTVLFYREKVNSLLGVSPSSSALENHTSGTKTVEK